MVWYVCVCVSEGFALSTKPQRPLWEMVAAWGLCSALPRNVASGMLALFDAGVLLAHQQRGGASAFDQGRTRPCGKDAHAWAMKHVGSSTPAVFFVWSLRGQQQQGTFVTMYSGRRVETYSGGGAGSETSAC